MKHLSVIKGERPINCPDTFVEWAKTVIYGINEPVKSTYAIKRERLKTRIAQTYKKRQK